MDLYTWIDVYIGSLLAHSRGCVFLFFILKVTNQPTDTQTRPSRDSHAGGREKYMATHAFFLLPFLLCWALALSAGVHNLLTITCFVCVCVFLSFSPRVLSCPFTQKKITQLIVRYLGSMGFLGFLLWFPHKREIWYGIRESYHRLMVIAGAVWIVIVFYVFLVVFLQRRWGK